MRRRQDSGFLIQLIAVFLVCLILMSAQPFMAQAPTFSNPLNTSGPDPWLLYYDGFYYLATTTWSSFLTMRKSPTLDGLKTVSPVKIYTETDPSRCCNMWAPEFHLLDGPDGRRWYFYYTAGTEGNTDNQHTHVLESSGADPLGPYTYKARIFDTAHDGWAIDSSILQLDSKLYFLFSAFEGRDQKLFIAPMSNPWTIRGSRVAISSPTYDWEKGNLNVNEGPEVLQHEGKTFIIYSASFCGTSDYKLGMLIYTGGDPLRADSWSKKPEPVFQKSEANGVFGPGHNGFFKSPDGTEDWIVYHANDSATGGCDMGRTTRAQKFTWNADGTPNFGIPVALGVDIPPPSGEPAGIQAKTPPGSANGPVSRFVSYSLPDFYIRHSSFRARLDADVKPIADSQFRIVPGLADPTAISIQSVNYPGWYLRHRAAEIWLDSDDGDPAFKADATWRIHAGLADSQGISFESYNEPGKYIRRVISSLLISKISVNRDKADATFMETR